MIAQKYQKEYTKQEIEDFIASLEDCKDVDNAWRTLAYINASAYKGYGELTEEQKAYNVIVYEAKEEAICKLAEYGGDITLVGTKQSVETGAYVLYVRLKDGVQLSFHIYDRLSNNKTFMAVRRYRGNRQWEGVVDSYTYSGEEYKKLVTSIKQKRQAAVSKFKEYFGKRVSGIENFITEVVCDGKAIRVRVPKKSINKQFLLEDL